MSKPRLRSGSDIIAKLQSTEKPLDRPIRFGKKTLRTGKIVDKQFQSSTSLDMPHYKANGKIDYGNKPKSVKFEGKYYKINPNVI